MLYATAYGWDATERVSARLVDKMVGKMVGDQDFTGGKVVPRSFGKPFVIALDYAQANDGVTDDSVFAEFVRAVGEV
jgi:hypothetical protein